MELFPRFAWRHIFYSSNVPNDFYEITDGNPGIDNSLAVAAVTAGGQRKYLPYLMVNMLGIKSA